MKNIEIFFSSLFLFLLITVCTQVQAQGIKIREGAVMTATGNAYIVLNNLDMTNNGTFVATSGSTVRMHGTEPQTIGGSSAGTFYNLVTDNASNLYINNSETVNGTLTFVNGKIILGAYDLNLGANATINGSGSLNYIVTTSRGFLRQRVMNNATDVTYPVGLATAYLPVKIQLTVGSMADDFKVRVANGLYTAYDEGGVPTGSLIGGFAVNKTWYLEESEAGGSDAMVNLQWDAEAETTGFNRDWCDIGHFTGSSWVYSSASQASGFNPYSQVLSGITSFSPFSVFSQHITCSVEGSPFCASSPLQVNYTSEGVIPDENNFFTAQLSDASGNFSNPVDIGGVQSIGSGAINATVPATSIDGNAYRIRVSGSNPAGTGDDNGSDLAIQALHDITGNINYYNQLRSPLLSNISISLYQDGNQVRQDYAVTDGTYAFPDLCPGIYELRLSSDVSADGSVNTTDAAQVNYWGAHPYTIEKVRFYAGDVTGGSFFINSTDAQLIQSNFVYGTPFTKGGDWTFWKAGETINWNTNPAESYPSVELQPGSNLTADLYGLCTGDFNGSFRPSEEKSSTANLELISTGNRIAHRDELVEMPIQIMNTTGVGAVSLILKFPAALVQVNDVVMNDADNGLEWAVKEDELRIGWTSPYPLYKDEGASLLTLKLKTTDAFTEGNSIRFTLADDPLNELADESFEVIQNALLGTDLIVTSTEGIDEQPKAEGLILSGSPNPFNDFTTLNYILPVDGRVSLEITGILGNRISILADEMQDKGAHSVKFSPEGLEAGVYLATLRLMVRGDVRIRTVKIIKSNHLRAF